MKTDDPARSASPGLHERVLREFRTLDHAEGLLQQAMAMVLAERRKLLDLMEGSDPKHGHERPAQVGSVKEA